MPYIRVIYKTKNGFDYVSGDLLEALIRKDAITHFFRPSEKRWVSIIFDPVRRGGGWYQGPERRSGDPRAKSQGQKEDKGFYAAKGQGTNWLEELWGDIER